MYHTGKDEESELSELSRRFLSIIELLGTTAYKLSKEVKSITNSKVTHIKSGRNRPSEAMIEGLISRYPQINRVWLLTGEGEAVLPQSGERKTQLPQKEENKSQQDHTQINRNNLTVQEEAPYYENMTASAGLSYLTDNSHSPETFIKIPGVGVDAYINVFGDSMYPKYQSGDIIGIREVGKDLLFFGNVYVVEMVDGEAYIKYVRTGKDDDHWSLESENAKYQSRQFHLSKIRKIYKIKSIITRTSL